MKVVRIMRGAWFAVCFLLVLRSNHITCDNFKPQESYTTEPSHNEIEIVLNRCCNLNLNENHECTNELQGTVESDNFVVPSHLVSTNMSTKFRVSTNDLLLKSCKSEIVTIDLPLVVSDKRNKNYFIPNGYLNYENESYNMEEYCIDGKNATFIKVKICKPNCGNGERACIQKCCSLDKVYSFGLTNGTQRLKGCQHPQEGFFNPVIYHSARRRVTDEELKAMPGHHFIENYPSSFKYECPGNKTLFLTSSHMIEDIFETSGTRFHSMKFWLRKDGKLLYRGLDGSCEVIAKNHNWCIDGGMNYGPELLHYNNTEETLVIHMCALPKNEFMEVSVLYGSLMLFSSVFLILTIVVYGLLWERQTVHGWTIVTHTAALLFMYIFVATGHLLRSIYGVDVHNSSGCILIGVACHFFSLATFAWLTVLSFDVWYTFRAITPRRGSQSKGWSRYLKYSVFGWGIPVIIVITGLIIDGKRSDDHCLEMIPPAYGEESCYLQEKSLGIYLYLPMGVLLIANLLFFVITTFKLYQYRESTKMATKDDTQQQFYRLFVKLFFVLGIFWIFEAISWLISGVGMYWYWMVPDLINILRAVAVFFIFVCKPDIIKSLEQKYPCLKPVFVPCRYIFPKGKMRRNNTTTTDESINLNSSIRTKSSTIRSSVMSTET